MKASSPKLVLLLLVVWFTAAVAVSASGWLAKLRPPAPQVMIVVLTLASLAAARLLPNLWRSIEQVDVRAIVALHITRLVAGIGFLVLPEHGEGWQSFAVPAGYGDIAVGLLAIGMIIWVPLNESASSIWYYRAWNIFGFADILFVVGNAARLGFADSATMAPLLQLPLSLLPTFLVPLIIATHILLFRRLRLRTAN